MNPYTGEPVREEDSPGNYVIREEDGRLELVLVFAEFGTVRELPIDLAAPAPGAPRPAR